MKLSLNMIMKNESAVLLRLLQSVLPIIDYYVILDTGSTDGSIKIIKDFFDKHGIQGEIYVNTECVEIIDGKSCFIYDKARNEALKLLVGKADYGFWIDCDEELILSQDFDIASFKDKLSKYDLGSIVVNNTTQYSRRCLFKVSKPFYWIGKVHEVLVCHEAITHCDLDGLSVTVHADETSHSAEKYKQHALILQKQVDETRNPRDIFYLANSYKDSGDWRKAIEYYRKRVDNTGGFYEERYYSQFMLGVLTWKHNPVFQLTLVEFLKASELDPLRAEHIYNAIIILQQNNLWQTAYLLSKDAIERFHKKNPYPKRVLFIAENVYDKGLLDLHITNCQKLGIIDDLTALFVKKEEPVATEFKAIEREKITIAYISHNQKAWNTYLKNSLINLVGDFGMLSIGSAEANPAANYNKMLSLSPAKYVLFVHEDVTFGTNFYENIFKTIEQVPDFGALGIVGHTNGVYHWATSDKIQEVDMLDCCCILVNKEHGLRFDNRTFDDFHLYVEDYCLQVKNAGKKCYTILTNASEAISGDVYEKKRDYAKHHSVTVNERGYAWGRYSEYLEKLKSKWQKQESEVDVCVVSYAKTPELYDVTCKGLDTLLASETDIKFNIFVVESNKVADYNQYPNTKTIYPDIPFNYNAYLNLAIKEGKAPYVFLANNDLLYNGGWASEIIKQMKQHPEIMSASPFCPQVQKIYDNRQYILGYDLRNHFHGWAIFQKREIYDTIKELDTSCEFWYSDNLLIAQMKANGITHALIPNSIVNHHDKSLGVSGETILSDTEKQRMTTGQYVKFEAAKSKIYFK